MTGRTTNGTGSTGGDGSPGGGSDDVATVAALVADLAGATAGTPADLRRLVGLLGDRYGLGSRSLGRAVDLALLDAIADPVARGWAARDLLEVVRRRVGASAVPPTLDVLAGEAARRPGGGGPTEVAELAALGAEVWWDRGRPLVEQWTVTRGLAAAVALRTALGLVHTARTLPSLPRRDADEPSGAAPPGVDPKVLARVRGLLAKAESTSFPEEAEALSAKAQELMGRHALEAAVVAGPGTPEAASDGAAQRRIWLDAPYASAKAHLVHRVAAANRCRAVTLDALDMVTVVGHAADLATVELLATSLLLQADRAMLAAPSVGTTGDVQGSTPRGERSSTRATGDAAERSSTRATGDAAERSSTRATGATGGPGPSRTRSFRHAFLLSYATRIGERLASAAHEAQSRARAEIGESLLPVLAARAEVVDAAVGELFPRLVTRRASVGNRDGWDAGRAAADAASLSAGRAAVDR